MKRAQSGITWFEVLAICGIVVIVAAVLFPVLTTAKTSGKRMCFSRCKQIAHSATIYAADWDGRLMPRDAWMDGLEPYCMNPKLFHCPGVEREAENPSLYGYAFNSTLDMAKLQEVQEPSNTPMFYDSINLARNASDPFLSLPRPPRDHGQTNPYNVVVFADLRAREVR